MKTREQIYGREAAALIRDISMYKVMTEEQVLRLYPGKEDKIRNLLSYFVRQNRIWLVDGCYCAAPDSMDNMDRGLFAAVWVLVDMIDRVEYHSVGDYPDKIIFFADKQVYELVYAEKGKEILLSHVLADPGEDSPRFLVLVDDTSQIPKLNLPNVNGYCTVSPEGEVQYFKKE